MKLFVDSSAFIALADRADQDHEAATRFFRNCSPEIQMHTSNYILAETITRLRKTAGHPVALRWARATLKSPHITRHYVDEELEQETIRIFERYHDHPLSFVDCATVTFLQRLHTNDIFTFDQDFQRLGYHLVPGF